MQASTFASVAMQWESLFGSDIQYSSINSTKASKICIFISVYPKLHFVQDCYLPNEGHGKKYLP